MNDFILKVSFKNLSSKNDFPLKLYYENNIDKNNINSYKDNVVLLKHSGPNKCLCEKSLNDKKYFA